MFAVCDSEAHLSCSYTHIICKREIQRWKFQPQTSISVSYHHLYNLLHNGLYALALFYVACKDLLQPFNPVPKFIMIKSVVFLTYWQGVLVFLAAKSGFIKDTDEAAEFQNFIICVEMLIAAICHLYAFPYKEYAGANIGGSRGLTRSLAHALKLNDFYDDTVHQVRLVTVVYLRWSFRRLFLLCVRKSYAAYYNFVVCTYLSRLCALQPQRW